MTRILHVLGSLDRGGIETLLMNIYRKIDRTKIQFDFLIHTPEECAYTKEVLEMGGRVFSVPKRREGFFKNRNALNLFFEEHKEYNIVHMHLSSLSYITPLIIAKKNNIPIRIVHSHNVRQGGVFLHSFLHKFNQLFIGKIATHYFACSESAALWLYGSRSYKKCNYRVIQNAIDVNRYKYNPVKRQEVRDKLNIGKSQLVIGNVARFHPQKNHKFLLLIMAELVKKNPNILLLLIGGGSLKKEIEETISSLNLEENVILLGVRDDVNEVINAFDLFLLPSLYEGLGIVLVEAQANGLPVVASKDVIPKEVKLSDKFNFIGLNESMDKWTSTIINLLNTQRDDSVLEAVVEAGYDINDVASELEQFYLKL